MLKHEWHTTVLYLLGMIGRPLGRASCQSSPKPEGAELDSEYACQATIGSVSYTHLTLPTKA